MAELSPSILSLLGSESLLEAGITAALETGIKTIHFDVMDGVFVPAKTFGPELLDRFKESSFCKDVHLMVANPKEAISAFASKGADLISFHLEACKNEREVRECISLIHSLGKKAGLSIKPNTPVSALSPYYASLDLILLMSVEPGKGGQSYLEEATARLQEISSNIEKLPNHPILEVDGGINDKTAKLAVKAGANLLVVGSYLFGKGELPRDFASRVEGLSVL